MKRTLLATTALAIAVAAAVSVSAFADPAQRGTPGYHMGYSQNQMMGGPGMMMGGPQMMMDQMFHLYQVDQASLDKLKDKLSLTKEQVPAWDAYVNTLKDVQENIKTLHEGMDPKTIHDMSLEDHQAFMQGVWEGRQEDVKALNTARDKLFAVLTPDQQKQVTTLLSPQYGSGPCTDGQGPMRPGMGPRS